MNTFEQLAGGRYRVVRRLAQGGMGEVLLAQFPGDTTLAISPGLVVVKRVIKDANNRPHQCRMLREEARISLRLLHENLVESFFLDEDAGDPILVMEFLTGQSLAQVLGAAKKKKHFLPIDVVLGLIRAAACGLHFAHTVTDKGRPLGLIHRDVSPANIFLTYDGRVKVIDFGVAKADDSEIRTSTGVLKGKLGYMSPEHASGDVTLLPATDLWSLGVVLWESLCAERLFSNPSPADTLMAIANKPIPPPTVLRPDIPAPVAALCARLLERDQHRRIRTGAELVAALDGISGGQALSSATLGGFLSQRFAEQAQGGVHEAARCSKMRRSTPVAIGLSQGTAAQLPLEADAPTLVMTASSAAELMQRARQDVTDEDRFAAAPVTHVTVPRARTMASEPSADAHTIAQIMAVTGFNAHPPLEMPARTVAVPAANGPAASVPRPATRTGQRAPAAIESAQWLHGATLTFGILAVAMGALFSFLAPVPDVAGVVVYADNDGTDVVVALPSDVPAGHTPRLFSLARPPILHVASAAAPALTAQSAYAALAEAGVLTRASLPRTLRARVAALLPLVMVMLGMLSLALAIPGWLLAGQRRRRAQIGCVIVAVVASVWWLYTGGLGWPGFGAYRNVPTYRATAP